MAVVVASSAFKGSIASIIIGTGIIMGMQTYPGLADNKTVAAFGDVWSWGCTLVFTGEAIAKITACGLKPWRYFFDRSGELEPWNSFDFVIVCGSWIPGGGAGLMVLRLLRLVLVLKMARGFPKMRMALDALAKGTAAIGYVSLMMIICFYFFAVFGILLFKDNDPWHFGNLHIAMITLFRVATMEDWTDVMYINMYGCKEYGYADNSMASLCTKPNGQYFTSASYFLIFILVGSMVLLNLFIGVIATGMEESMDDLAKEDCIKKQAARLIKHYKPKRDFLKKVENIFGWLDVNGDGDVDADELKDAMCLAGLAVTQADIKAMVNDVDSDCDGILNYAEFVELLLKVEIRTDATVDEPVDESEFIEEMMSLSTEDGGFTTEQALRHMGQLSDLCDKQTAYIEKLETLVGKTPKKGSSKVVVPSGGPIKPATPANSQVEPAPGVSSNANAIEIQENRYLV